MGKKYRLALLIVPLLIAGAAVLAWHPAIAPVAQRSDFSREQVARGAELAAIGDCAVCHTAPDGTPYAGGRGVPTPFGVIHATNITPDTDTGIGTWSLAAFTRAMRDGIGRSGEHLYPVLPYPHFTRATDDDLAALYAFMLTRRPVRQAAPANDLPFPFDYRVLLAGWNLLFLRPGPWQPDPAHDAAWNRGAYLVEAVAHCGACHSPRNALGAETKPLAGGEAEGWYAPPLNDAAEPWTRDALATYLRTGFQAGHGAAAGPMTAVTDALGAVPPGDIDAIATYVASRVPQGAPEAAIVKHAGDPRVRPLFDGACAVCHDNGLPSLCYSPAVNAPDPRSTVRVILLGIPAREGKAAPYMPAFAGALTDAQIASLAGYLRAEFSGNAPWSDIQGAVAKAKEQP